MPTVQHVTEAALEQELEGFEVLEGAHLLQKIPLFRYLSYDETNALAALVRKEQHPKGKTIVEQNALGQALFLVTQGTVRVEKVEDIPGDTDLSDNRSQVVGKLGEGQLFGEMSLIDDMLTSARIVADTDIEVLRVDRLPLEQLLTHNDKLAAKVFKAFCRTLTEKLRKANDQLAERANFNNHTT